MSHEQPPATNRALALGVFALVASVGFAFAASNRLASSVAGVKIAAVSSSPASAPATPAATSTPCTETDNGNNPYVAGTTTYAYNSGTSYSYTQSVLDTCLSADILNEISCGQGGIVSSTVRCTAGGCANRACKGATSIPAVKNCFDSDGGGAAYEAFTAGKVTVVSNVRTTTYSDKCLSDSVLQEVSCVSPYNAKVTSKKVTCQGGCAFDQCARVTTAADGTFCYTNRRPYDSSKPSSYYNASCTDGGVASKGGTYKDSCKNGVVAQHYCGGGSWNGQAYTTTRCIKATGTNAACP